MLRFVLAAIFLLLSASLAQAAVCTVDIDDLDFGQVDTIGNAQATTSANVAIHCDGITEGTETVTLCANIGAGSGGAAGAVRKSLGSSGSLAFALYGDGSVPWGSSTTPSLGEPYQISLSVSGTSASQTLHLHGVVPSGQTAVAVGDYSSSFGPGEVDFKYAEGSLDCAAPAGADDASASFTVRAGVPANCLLQTADLDFGTTGIIGSPIDGDTSLGVTCTPGTGYSISIGGGGSGDPTHRQMHAGPGKTVDYGLYSDPGRTLPWGTDEDSTVPGTGNGVEDAYPVYGRIPPQAAAPGSYSDTVVVTITY